MNLMLVLLTILRERGSTVQKDTNVFQESIEEEIIETEEGSE